MPRAGSASASDGAVVWAQLACVAQLGRVVAGDPGDDDEPADEGSEDDDDGDDWGLGRP